jgi:16S rRNA (adenine1518-N6/adenine1519-N6)-dimethyltransferase
MSGKKHHFNQNLEKVRPKKFLGQHFLKDENVASRIAETLEYSSLKYVIEVGPGTGVLTQFLIGKPPKLIAFEVDRESVAFLNEKYEDPISKSNSFQLVSEDFLKADLLKVTNQQDFAIIGNFPYNISSQILFKALDYRAHVSQFAGMFQKEVAQRICEAPGSKTYGILSVLSQAFYEVEYLFTVKPSNFNPPPKVDSGVIKLTRRAKYQLDCDEKLFFKVVKTAFQQRRKTLRNSLKTFNLSDNLKSDLIFAKRPEQLSYIEFVELTQKLAQDAV